VLDAFEFLFGQSGEERDSANQVSFHRA
jgi:hypothetical protein